MISGFTKNLIGSLAALTLILLSGCGGDPGTSALMGDYIAASHTTYNVDIVHDVNQSIGTQLAVDIKVVGIQDKVFGAALDLAFDPNIIQFVELRPGGFLEATSKNGVTYEASAQGNDLIIGISQTADDPGTTGDGILTTVVFRLLNPGCTKLIFVVTDKDGIERSKLLNTPLDPAASPQPISGITWSLGGNIRVRLEGDTQDCTPPSPNI